MQVLRENNSNVVNIKKITHQFDKISNRIIFERDRLSLLKQDDFLLRFYRLRLFVNGLRI